MSISAAIQPSKFLQFALRVDAIGCAVFALITFDLMIFSNTIVGQLDVPNSVLIVAALVALLGAPLLWSMVRRERLHRSSVWVLMASNLAWAIVSIVAVVADWIEPTALGAAIIIGQAVMTGAIAEMEFIGYRRSVDDRAPLSAPAV